MYIYTKNKTFIIRSYISVSSKPKVFEGLEETEI